MTAESWYASRDAVPDGWTQYTVYGEDGERIATVFREDAINLIAASPTILAALEALTTAVGEWRIDADGTAWAAELDGDDPVAIAHRQAFDAIIAARGDA